MSSQAINRTARQNIHVTKLQIAASAPLKREAVARLQAQQAKAREDRAIAAAKKANAAAKAVKEAEAAKAAAKVAEAEAAATKPE